MSKRLDCFVASTADVGPTTIVVLYVYYVLYVWRKIREF